MPDTMTRQQIPWVIVAGGFHQRGGMDKANYALAEYLASRGTPVHLVCHSVDEGLAKIPSVRTYVAPLPRGAVALGQLFLGRLGTKVARRVSAANANAQVVVNGGNCIWPGINWVHYVHHAWQAPRTGVPVWYRMKSAIAENVDRYRERRALQAAKLILANSKVTQGHVISLCGVSAEKVRTVYLGSDPDWGIPDASERSAARSSLSIPADQPVAVFVGALGFDNRKGLDLLLDAWKHLEASPGGWDVLLLVAGSGGAMPAVQTRIEALNLQQRVRLLGFSDQVATLLAAADVLVSPVRYEAYGLNVQEALCRGVTSIVSAQAGVAERYPKALQPLLLEHPLSVEGVAAKLRLWRANVDDWRAQTRPFGDMLRSYTWQDMAQRMVEVCSDV